MTEPVDLVFGAARGEIDVSDDFDIVDDRIGAMFAALGDVRLGSLVGLPSGPVAGLAHEHSRADPGRLRADGDG